MDNGTYKITHKTAAWTAGFYVTIANNKITTAYSPFHSTVFGSISSASLYKNSTSTATYSFLYSILIGDFDTGVIASITNSTLNVSKK